MALSRARWRNGLIYNELIYYLTYEDNLPSQIPSAHHMTHWTARRSCIPLWTN